MCIGMISLIVFIMPPDQEMLALEVYAWSGEIRVSALPYLAFAAGGISGIMMRIRWIPIEELIDTKAIN